MRHIADLNERQREAALHIDGPLLIVAGAGAGKTKTITHRIAHIVHSGVAPHRILAVTFTNKAASEMRERVLALLAETHSARSAPAGSPWVLTFHALSVRLLREFAAEAGLKRSFLIWDRDDQLRAVKAILKEKNLGERFSPRAILSRISYKKGEGVGVDEFAANAASYFEREVAGIWKQYDARAAEGGALDFDDLLLRALALLRERADVRAKLQQRWSHITIDEYQDTNIAQYEIARLLAGERMNICAVGDTDQLIYGWRGAVIDNLLSFEKNFPGTRVVFLEQNYRSTQTILTAANAVIAKNVNRHEKHLFTDNPTGEAILVFEGATEADEARFVAHSARELLGSGTPASEVAVLFRENFQSRALEEAFLAEGLPYRVLGVRFFDRAEVKDVLSYLRLALNPASRGDLARAARAARRGIGDTTLEKMARGEDASLSPSLRKKAADFRAALERIRRTVEGGSASRAVQAAIVESGLEKALRDSDEAEDEDRLANVRELVSLASRYDALPAPEGVERLLEDAALMSEQDSLALPTGERRQKPNAISLMTVHASKGLEFDAVFVTGLEQGLFPSIREGDGGGAPRDPEEERRLFYVALTRARRHLYLTYAATRLKYGSREYALPSEFFEDIDARLLSFASARAAPRRRGILDMYEDDIR
ncbi:hypothetical protein COU20_01965 [Candidatus Kaiserbacteria bacterium CG10_big_fil_rev_8_21_14_0_10_59_10]|uniref:DNA 3'-5' helicase n=1 Tax=Candidatus Kaiserbacteria bacterium CG10_big_fil_rev_8_21_14_0_10_59_10 TaxID=1974612 RepID=A0A2H0U808_9BACT|nr:MAG: hypothetical protein COU20_01965 [Candidatus Kaiserbacteria bacterium CG10_big_fil_rev_8_21_14_0_10_59_10]